MKAIGIILAGGQNEKLKELGAVRATSAMPVGSCYRAIDFPLSNMANSGINKVAVITQYNSRSLHDHLNSSKWWGFGRKHGGLFVLAPFLSKDGNFGFRGTADSIYQNISFLRRSNEPYVVITGGDGIYKLDYNEVLSFHVEKDADITVVCKNVNMDVTNFGVVDLDENGRLIEFEEKPLEAFSDTISLGIYIIRRELLISLLEEIIPEGRYDFVRDIITRYRKRLNMYGYMFGERYWGGINSAESYFNINMDFLRPDIRRMFFAEQPHIETKNKDEPPAKYNANSQVRNCLIGCGSIIDGMAENSVLFRRVMVGENAVVRNSIIMEGCVIGQGAMVVDAILDKDVRISEGQIFMGEYGNPKIMMKGSTL